MTYYTMDDLRLGQGSLLCKGWSLERVQTLDEAVEHYRGIPITKRKVLGLTDGFHVLELVKNVPLLLGDPEGEDVLASELGEPLPQWADTPEARQAVRTCLEALGLRYQIEGKILAPIPVNKKQRRKKLAGKYLWPDVPGNPASALRWVYLAGKGWLAPTVLKESAAVLPLVLKVRADGITDKGDYRPLELEPWEFRLLARRTLERLEQNMTKCEVCK
ncbi:hypothetical protein EV206_1438 [Flavonifractor plautii DSM 6740]|uniref:hypothetical protein n=2 Tax=Flavonifractor plautii TaxID=292800 RepID=UPI001053D59F|nr:hypothetical protein [Flavonifractor plautii]MCB5781105.1 hypothetical protein [Flavonifractor plautii]MDB7913259.1 hypothetical protein [Flavonifractor plautii]MDB7917586.1 hypothetical protein [Flavonifractor plautii]TCO87960.1 hypothetical protein EV206_1438 [Flavonifractor plautii DSM 6740]